LVVIFVVNIFYFVGQIFFRKSDSAADVRLEILLAPFSMFEEKMQAKREKNTCCVYKRVKLYEPSST